MKKLGFLVLAFAGAILSFGCKIEHTKTVSADAGDGRVTEHSVKLKETLTEHEHGPEVYHSEKREDVPDED